jgi:class 3 adenylate cyclase
MTPADYAILVVDDNEDNRLILAGRFTRQGYRVTLAENGVAALAAMRAAPFDLVLLDIMMPEMNGYEVLRQVKADPQLSRVPIIVTSAVDSIASIVQCIELGAEDYLFKPINVILLNARVNACLEKKRLRDQEQGYLRLVQTERERAEHLLLNILPRPIAERLKLHESPIADSFSAVTVLFADIVDFTQIAIAITPAEVVRVLNRIFSTFDHLARRYGVEKIKTMGDAYMAVGGLPIPSPHHAAAVADLALAMQHEIRQFTQPNGQPFALRIGLHSGPVVAGVIGEEKFTYDLWGETVNIASRMESQGQPDRIQVTEATYERLRDSYHLEERGLIPVKGIGDLRAYFLTAHR